VLKPGGRLAVYDVISSDGRPLIFPVPWANGEEMSFLLTVDAMRKVLESTGFLEGSCDKIDRNLNRTKHHPTEPQITATKRETIATRLMRRAICISSRGDRIRTELLTSCASVVPALLTSRCESLCASRSDTPRSM
jgi:hypothetical protein